MALREVRIEKLFWATAPEPRREEWRTVMHELVLHAEFAVPGEPAVLRVVPMPEATDLRLDDALGGELAWTSVPRVSLSRHVTEYVDICRQLGADGLGWGSPRFEALDMGKKLAHDDAARTLVPLCAPIGADHATCRRLFTLLLALRVDTTRLVGIHGHRPIR